ncbi:hypothetical protein [Aquimarina rubra]|uniref:Natural product n=1 Tax=Aquimarina rubra TaxID=1920033 RepID=A0ABW5LER9_9FLAO
MLKNILKIEGVQELDKTEQKLLQGGLGWRPCTQNQGLCCQGGGSQCYAGVCTRRGCFYY